MGLLDGKVAVITGAGSGLAKASATVFVREGARVVAADISGAQKDTAAEIGGGVVPVHCDVTSEADIEAGEHNIRVNAICPGYIQTEIMGANPPPGIHDKAALKRGGQPSEVAEVAAFLASDKASFVTGVIIPVDGGWAAKLA